MSYFVYTVTHLPSGRVYVGQTQQSVERRWKGHHHRAQAGSRSMFHRALRRHPADQFAWSVVETHATEAAVKRAEVALIAALRARGTKLYNLTDGGDGTSGYRHGPEALAKMAAVHRGTVLTEAHKKKLSDALRNREFSPETRALISASKRGHATSLETRAKIARSLTGRTLSAETREKVAAAQRGQKRRPRTEEERKTLSDALRGKPWSPARRAAHRARYPEPEE